MSLVGFSPTSGPMSLLAGVPRLWSHVLAWGYPSPVTVPGYPPPPDVGLAQVTPEGGMPLAVSHRRNFLLKWMNGDLGKFNYFRDNRFTFLHVQVEINSNAVLAFHNTLKGEFRVSHKTSSTVDNFLEAPGVIWRNLDVDWCLARNSRLCSVPSSHVKNCTWETPLPSWDSDLQLLSKD